MRVIMVLRAPRTDMARFSKGGGGERAKNPLPPHLESVANLLRARGYTLPAQPKVDQFVMTAKSTPSIGLPNIPRFTLSSTDSPSPSIQKGTGSDDRQLSRDGEARTKRWRSRKEFPEGVD